MKFEEALELMREGKKMTTKEFDKHIYFGIKYDLLCRYEDEKEIKGSYLHSATILSDTWYEYKEPILDDTEKNYLEAVLRPFKGRIKFIGHTQSADIRYEYIYFAVNECGSCSFPYFKAGTMYKGMELDKAYTPKELGLFEEEK